MSIFLWPAYANSPKKQYFYQDIGRLEILAGVASAPRPAAVQRLQCLILAGGLATRMRPLTETIPKALLPVEGRPFIDHQLAWLAAHGVTDVVLSVGYLGEAIRAHVGDGAALRPCASASSTRGPNLRGTAGARAAGLRRGRARRAVPADLRRLVPAHRLRRGLSRTSTPPARRRS